MSLWSGTPHLNFFWSLSPSPTNVFGYTPDRCILWYTIPQTCQICSYILGNYCLSELVSLLSYPNQRFDELCFITHAKLRTVLPYKVKIQYVQIIKQNHTSIKQIEHPISSQSILVIKGCMNIMFEMADAAFSYWRASIVCLFLQGSFKEKESS